MVLKDRVLGYFYAKIGNKWALYYKSKQKL